MTENTYFCLKFSPCPCLSCCCCDGPHVQQPRFKKESDTKYVADLEGRLLRVGACNNKGDAIELMDDGKIYWHAGDNNAVPPCIGKGAEGCVHEGGRRRAADKRDDGKRKRGASSAAPAAAPEPRRTPPARPARASARGRHTCSTALRVRVCYVTDNTITNERSERTNDARASARGVAARGGRGVQVPAVMVHPIWLPSGDWGTGRYARRAHPRLQPRSTIPSTVRAAITLAQAHARDVPSRAVRKWPTASQEHSRELTPLTHPRRPHATILQSQSSNPLAHSPPRRTRAEPTRCRSLRTTMARR